jgi:hypothetical protein
VASRCCCFRRWWTIAAVAEEIPSDDICDIGNQLTAS